MLKVKGRFIDFSGFSMLGVHQLPWSIHFFHTGFFRVIQTEILSVSSKPNGNSASLQILHEKSGRQE